MATTEAAKKPKFLNVLVVKGEDRRRRWRFVTEPLSVLGHTVHFLPLHPLRTYLRRLAGFLRQQLLQRGGAEWPHVIILIGLSPKLIPLVIGRGRGRPALIARLGGDPFCAMEELTAALWAARSYRAWLATSIDLWARHWILRRVDGIMVVNPAMLPPLAEAAGQDVARVVVPQFCFGSARPRPSYELRQPVSLLTVTNLKFASKAEGVLWVIERLAEIADHPDQPPMRLRVAGAGRCLDPLRAAVDNKRLPPRLTVEFLGFVQDVDELYEEADVFLYRSELDSTPNVLLESKRFGLPALANTYAAFESVIVDGESGFLYRDADEFRTKFGRLLEDADLRRSLGEAALREHLTRFNVASSARQMSAALDEVLARRFRSPAPTDQESKPCDASGKV